MVLVKKKISVIYNGLDDNHIKNNNYQKLKIGFIGCLNKQKGVNYLIEAMKKVVSKFPNVKLEIIGDGQEKENLIIQSKSIQGNIIFLGQKKNIYNYLKNWCFLVVPSISESFGQVVLEASMCEKPTIATKTGGLPELIINNKTGILANKEDSDDLSKKIIYLLSNREKNITLGKEARKLFSKEFSAKIMTQNMEKIYKNIFKK